MKNTYIFNPNHAIEAAEAGTFLDSPATFVYGARWQFNMLKQSLENLELQKEQLATLVQNLVAVIDHAIYLDLLGEGSTKAWAESEVVLAKNKLIELEFTKETE